jgi:transposase
MSAGKLLMLKPLIALSLILIGRAQQVTCPQGHLSEHWIPAKGPRGRPTIEVQSHKEACRACPERTRCTRSKDSPRGLTLHVRQEHEALQQARQRQETTEFERAYGRRAGIKGAISQATVSREMRRSRYVGLKKTHFQHGVAGVIGGFFTVV